MCGLASCQLREILEQSCEEQDRKKAKNKKGKMRRKKAEELDERRKSIGK
jgi:hypothetical protein